MGQIIATLNKAKLKLPARPGPGDSEQWKEVARRKPRVMPRIPAHPSSLENSDTSPTLSGPQLPRLSDGALWKVASVVSSRYSEVHVQKPGPTAHPRVPLVTGLSSVDLQEAGQCHSASFRLKFSHRFLRVGTTPIFQMSLCGKGRGQDPPSAWVDHPPYSLTL